MAVVLWRLPFLISKEKRNKTQLMEFKELKISEETLKALDDMGFESPSPIQEQTIPALLEGRDLIGQAQTGTGKTAAFAIPIVEKVETNGITQALILCPTRELCMQVTKEIEKLAKYKKDIKILSVYGLSLIHI